MASPILACIESSKATHLRLVNSEDKPQEEERGRGRGTGTGTCTRLDLRLHSLAGNVSLATSNYCLKLPTRGNPLA